MECVGNLGKQAIIRAAMAMFEVAKEKRPPPRNKNPRAMCIVKWEPYLQRRNTFGNVNFITKY